MNLKAFCGWVVFGSVGLGCEGVLSASLSTTEAKPATEVPTSAPFVMPSGDPTAPDVCAEGAIASGAGGLKRLSLAEQRNAYRDLLGDATLNPALEPESGPILTEVEVEALNVAAKTLVATGKHLTELPCPATGGFNATCLQAFINGFGQKVFRRPVLDTERQWLTSEVYEAVRTNTELSPPATFREAIDAVAQAMLQSPQFLYVLKEGVPDPSLPAGVRRLTGYERAANLSFLFWKSTPDAELMAAAASGALDTREGVRAQAERLLNAPRAKANVRSFAARWLELDGNAHQPSLEAASKSATAFPFDSPALRSAMREEVAALYEDVFFRQSASFSALMTSPRAYVNRSLAQMYGMASPPASDTTYEWKDHDATQRAGLFTRAAFLTAYSPQEQKSAIRRGVFLLRNALCLPLGDPPPDVNNVPSPTIDHAITLRASTEARTASPSCQGCHSRINPLGFAFENYDAMGRYHTAEEVTYRSQPFTLPVSAAVTPVGTDFDAPVNGAVELSSKLAQSGMMRDCLAYTWFKSTAPETLTSSEACAAQRVMRRFRQTDDMRDLLLSVASDDTALFVRETP